MRKLFVALLLLLGATAFSANYALALEDQEGIIGLKMVTARMAQELQSRAARLGTSTNPIGSDDTTWVGYTPGHFSSTNNYWSVYSGTGKDGYQRVINGQAHKGDWDWDAPVNGDSLQGWWPMRMLATETLAGGTDLDRPHTCIDFGNQADYVINESRGATWQTAGFGAQPGWRTIGVDGVWHRDGGSTVTAAGIPAPTWAPLGGSFSAWMGLRADGDNTTSDALTGNPFNQRVTLFNQTNATRAGGADKKYPGYSTQMDQILYRDIDFQGKTTSNLTVSFSWRTNMSTDAITGAQRFGWFNHDPLKVTSSGDPNNFISGNAAGATNAPRDSFMVYVGSGVDGNQWLGSDGTSRNVYDPKHRWFAEVLHADWDPASNPADPRPRYYKELLSTAGNNATTASSFTISNTVLTPFLAKNNKIRLAFRVKTNLFFDDDRSGGRTYSSGGAGAAVVDNVTYQVGSNPQVNFGDFESASAINNDPAVSALDAWKSTGKPPAVFQHTEQLTSVLYEDICGQKGEVTRICNMGHGIVSMGDHENSERHGGLVAGRYDRDLRQGIVSPTIVFAQDNGGGVNGKNSQGLLPFDGVNDRVGDAFASEDWYIHYDIYAGIFDGNNGSFWRFGWFNYPCRASDTGYDAWGNLQQTGFIFFQPIGKQCFIDNEGARTYGLLRTSSALGIPDSIKMQLQSLSLCYAFGVPSGCAPSDGAYWDNAALAIIDGTPSQLNVDIWQWIQDAFPANENAGFPGTAALFDTTAAWVQSGLNIAQDTNNPNRFTVSGDSTAIQSSDNTKRVDMVFRILPGPGNYQPIGQGHTGNLRKVPSNPATVSAGDGSFWDILRTNPGEFSSNPGGMTNLKAGWNANFWCSVRCDTAEANLYALQGRGVLGGPGSPTLWQSTVHESDKRFSLLGITKNRCFVRTATAVLTDIICDGSVPTYLPAGTLGTTKEETKIIPDGLLTPGAHVEYFFRDQKDSDTPGPPDGFCPDTNSVFPQNTEGPSFDGHRWQEFSVLPDRWKDQQYQHPVHQTFGHGPAQMLVVDWNDRRGDERAWIGVADTIGATAPEKFGANNGYHAAGGQDVNDPAARVAKHGGQAGTTWDFYQVKASESIDTGSGTIGSRLSHGHPAIGDPPALLGDKSARNAPTPQMLDAYYTEMLILTGDLNSNIFGPFLNKTDNDVGIVENWLDNGSTSAQNRGLWGIGDGFVEANTLNATELTQVSFVIDYFRADLVSHNFQAFGGVSDFTIDLRVFPEWQGKTVASLYGMRNQCVWTNDVLTPATPLLTAATSQYEKKTAPVGGYYAGIFKDWDPTSPYKTLVDGWDLIHLATRFDANTVGRSAYMYKVFTNVWSKIWAVQGTPIVPLDVPTLDDGSLVNFVNVGGNPMYGQASAKIKFGLARADRVLVDVYDIGGRRIRTVVDHAFAPGTHEVVWDGLDNAGRQVARGVYFTQVKFAGQNYVQSRKLTLLR